MFEISFLSVEIAFTAVWLLVRIIIWKRQKRIDWKREAVLLLMYLNLAVIIRFVFFPRDLVDGRIQPLIFEATTVFPLRINLIPLVHLFDYDSIQDIIWNVDFFKKLGYTVYCTLEDYPNGYSKYKMQKQL